MSPLTVANLFIVGLTAAALILLFFPIGEKGERDEEEADGLGDDVAYGQPEADAG